MGRAILVGILIFALGAMMMFSVLPAMAQPEITPDTDIQPDTHNPQGCAGLLKAIIAGATIPTPAIVAVCS